VRQDLKYARRLESGSHCGGFRPRTVVSVSEILDRVDRGLPAAVAS